MHNPTTPNQHLVRLYIVRFFTAVCNGVCVNGGTCTTITVEDQEQAACECAERYNGTRCEIDLGPCHPNPCVFGDCLERPPGFDEEFFCLCVGYNFAGPLCELGMSPV